MQTKLNHNYEFKCWFHGFHQIPLKIQMTLKIYSQMHSCQVHMDVIYYIRCDTSISFDLRAKFILDSKI